MMSFTRERKFYEAAEGFSLQHVSGEEFGKSWVVYRRIWTEDFSQTFDSSLAEIREVPFCFEIQKDGQNIGGVIMMPNRIGDIFFRYPEKHAFPAMESLLGLLSEWSDSSEPITAQAIAPHFLDYFLANGFSLVESRHWMIRPTENLEFELDGRWRLVPVQSVSPESLSVLLESAFRRSPGTYGQRSLESHLESVANFLEKLDPKSACSGASAGVYERFSGALAALCFVELHKGLPSIRFVAVDPSFQRRGLGTALVCRAVARLYSEHRWVKLAVTVGNTAVDLYRSLGFVAGDVLHNLSRPPGN